MSLCDGSADGCSSELIPAEWVERVRAARPELPQAMAARFVLQYTLPSQDATMLTQDSAMARYFETTTGAAVAIVAPNPAEAGDRSSRVAHVAKLVANWMMGELARRLNAEGLGLDVVPLRPATLGRLVARVADGTLSNSAARQVFDALWSSADTDVDALIDAKGLKQPSDSGALESVVDAVIAANARSVGEYRAGKEKAFNALVGQAMKATQGKANPEQVAALLKRKLA